MAAPAATVGVPEESVAAIPRPYLEEAGATQDENTWPGSGVTDDNSKTRLPRPYLEIDTTNDASEVSPRYDADRKISLDVTPLSCKSQDSSAEYHLPCQTIIILDWDDTLCPSTTCMRTHGLSVLGEPPQGEVKRQLEALTEEVKLLIEAASQLAEKVVVVTNAEEGWVDLSCKAWLPGLQPTLALCEVASARSNWEPRGVVSPAGWKAKAFEEVIDRFYSRYQNQSWKNIISIGDAPHEREALARVSGWAPPGKKCRSKSVKFVLRPSIEQLCRELQLLRESLRVIVQHDDDLDLHFSLESLTDLSEPLGTPSPTGSLDESGTTDGNVTTP
eukprot:TRINITY_DN19923_c0_g1_i1.p1 TRINITY_DN19923_c0_g1~~TRINITY_DN19923_c0_g1_i1.p1  ORF type:complete len:332 (+),score=72.11 TRINITY_DN19923_c0_g1_i1:95-1090(+)